MPGSPISSPISKLWDRYSSALPILISIWSNNGALYKWAQPLSAIHEDHLLAIKRPYLNPGFFTLRLIIYFVVWSGIALWYRRLSLEQDSTRQADLTRRMEKFSAPGLVIYAITAHGGQVKVAVERHHTNVIDAASAGASDGTMLAINVAAMLIAFLAFIAMFDYLLGLVNPQLSLARVFAWVFAPVAVLMGVPPADVPAIGDLLGTKLVANEFVAYIKLTGEYKDVISPRSYTLATYALTGFANFASIGIQLGGIGGMAPTRRGDLARLGSRALLAGFIATLINASIAAVLL